MDNTNEPSTVENSAFVFDIRSLLITTPSAFSTPKISSETLNRLDYLANLTDGAVGIISDREIEKMKGVLHSVANNLYLIGSHGGEARARNGNYLSAKPGDALQNVRNDISSFVKNYKPCYIENKKLGIAVHFGPAPELSRTIYEKLSETAELLGNSYQVIEGHFCWELKEANHNTGTALSRLFTLPEFAGKTTCLFGTDPTIEPAFLATNLAMGNTIFVGEKERNTRAQYRLGNSGELGNWIKRLCITQEVPVFNKERASAKSIAA